MKLADFDYPLPGALVAQQPIEPRDASRLLVMNRGAGTREHRLFSDLGEYLREGDLLVANNSRVLRARLKGRRADTGGSVEVLLLNQKGDDTWEALVRPGKRIRKNVRLEFPGGEHERSPSIAVGVEGTLFAEVLSRTPFGGRLLRLSAVGDLRAAIEARGAVPLPPYIRAALRDPERYQTVYARLDGSAAAPTAGLHFTPRLIERLAATGVRMVFVTLHVGLDTFRPVRAENPAEHEMHSEYAELPEEAAKAIESTRRQGGRVVAVGTTAVRVIETATSEDGTVVPFRGWTRLFIYPGYRFKTVDALITNFHLPRSTLLMLVSAFSGRDFVLQSYAEAARLGYRFYSFGDATLVL